MKFLFVALFLVTFVVGAYSSSATFGNIYTYSSLISKDTVVRFPVNGQFLTELYRFPKDGQANSRVISGVRVLDNFTNTTGATPSLYSGGQGFTFTSVNLKSQLSRGINSTIEVWG